MTRRDYTLIVTPRPPSLAPFAAMASTLPVTANPKPSTKLRTLHQGAAALAMISAALILPACVAAVMGLPWFVGAAAWVLNIVLAVLLSPPASPPAHRPIRRAGSSSYEPGGIGASYAYQDWSSGGDCGGDGGAC